MHGQRGLTVLQVLGLIIAGLGSVAGVLQYGAVMEDRGYRRGESTAKECPDKLKTTQTELIAVTQERDALKKFVSNARWGDPDCAGKLAKAERELATVTLGGTTEPLTSCKDLPELKIGAPQEFELADGRSKSFSFAASKNTALVFGFRSSNRFGASCDILDDKGTSLKVFRGAGDNTVVFTPQETGCGLIHFKVVSTPILIHSVIVRFTLSEK